MTETKVKDKFKSNLKMFKNPTYQQCHFGHNPSVKADEFILDTHITYIEGGGKKRYLKMIFGFFERAILLMLSVTYLR